MLATSKLNSIGSKIYEALMNNQISQEDFMTIISEERNYRELKENISLMKGKEDKTMLITMLLLSKLQKNTQSINPVNSKTSNGKTMILSRCAICNSKKSKFIKE